MISPKTYAGIGSRQTPQEVLNLMEQLAYKLARQGHTLRSGAAYGADQAFELGCVAAGGKKEIFIPWNGFSNRRHGVNDAIAGVSEEALRLAASLHPSWNTCSSGARLLHARNCYQVLGRNLDDPVSDVFCWTPGGTGSGGTGQALRLAKKLDIPIWDMGLTSVFNMFKATL